MTTQNSGKCGHCGRPLILSTSNNNKGQPIKCLCRRRQYATDSAYARRTNHRKRITGSWHESRGVTDEETNEQYRERLREKARKYRAANPEKVKDFLRKHSYGLEPGEYRRMLKAQRGKCKLCLNPMPRPHIDHCHKTNKVRGLLCGLCNGAIGRIEKDSAWVDRALQYLKS